MANKNFRVRHGLDIGDSVSITDAGVVTGISSLAVTTLDATNVEVTNIKAKDGTAAMIIADSTGVVTVSSQLNVDNLNINTNTISSTNAFTSTGSSISGTTLTIGTLSTGTISIGQSIHGGTVLTNTVITANISGTGSGSTWTVSKSQTVASSSLSGAGDITLAPNTTGDVVLTLNNGGNLINSKNYVLGNIRNSTAEAAGYIATYAAGGPSVVGVSLDNGGNTTPGPGAVFRSYSGGAVTGNATRGRILFEKARGTLASPTAVQNGDFLGSIDASGYSTTGWQTDNQNAVSAFFGFIATENWVSNTNLGTSFTLSQAPQATTITTAANLVSTLQIQPENFVMRGNRLSISQASTVAFTATGCSTSGTTLTIGTVTAGTVAVGQVMQLAGALNGHYIVANISGSGSGSTWQLSGSPGTLSGLTVTGNVGYFGSVPATSATTDILQDLRLIKNTIKSNTGTTQITTSASGTTLALAGTAITLEDTAGTDYLVLDANQALFSKVVRTKITTASVAQGATYTPAATALNSIILTITAGSGTTTIDVSNLTVAGENGVYDIMVYNNSGGSINANGFLITNGGNTVLDHGSSIANGSRAIFEINCIDIYANAQFVGDAV